MNNRKDQLSLECEKFHIQHPEVWRMFCRFTFEKINAGFEHYSAKGVFERIRWESPAGADGLLHFKLNNNYSAFYARRFMNLYKDSAGFFQLREQVSEGKPVNHRPEFIPALIHPYMPGA